MWVCYRLVAKLHNGNKMGLAEPIPKGRLMKKEYQTILDRLKEYRYTTQETYESISREIGVSYGTVFRWLNKEPKISGVHIKAIDEFLKKKNFVLLFLGVSWILHFDNGQGFKTVDMFKEFQSYKQIEQFIKHAPQENKVFECEHSGEHGYCKVSDFKIEEGK